MIRILILILAFSAQALAGNWEEIKKGEDSSFCFEKAALQLSKPFFGDWTSKPGFNDHRIFTAAWEDNIGGTGVMVLPTGKPPAKIYCERVDRDDSWGNEFHGIVCVPNMANAVVELNFSRSVLTGVSTVPALVEQTVPLIVIQNNRMFCTR